jgi:hypothetical protein
MAPNPAEPTIAPVAAPLAVGEWVLRVSDVSKAFHRGPPWHRRRVEVLRDASLAVGAGELVGWSARTGRARAR